MTTLVDQGPRLDLATTAAEAALALLPSSHPLRVGTAVSDIPAELPAGRAVSARFTGACSGEVTVIVGEDLAAALAQSPLGELDLATAVRAAIEAAAGAFGPVVVEPGQQMEPDVALGSMAAKGQLAVVPLLDDEQVRAAVAILVRPWPAPEPTKEAPRPAASAGTADSGPGLRAGLDLLHDVEMDVAAELGRTRMSVRELLSLAPGAVVELDRAAGNPADLLVNGRLIARGEVVVIDENFGIRLTEIVSP
jgi:flagellar motor switch protein FliN/FliY